MECITDYFYGRWHGEGRDCSLWGTYWILLHGPVISTYVSTWRRSLRHWYKPLWAGKLLPGWGYSCTAGKHSLACHPGFSPAGGSTSGCLKWGNALSCLAIDTGNQVAVGASRVLQKIQPGRIKNRDQNCASAAPPRERHWQKETRDSSWHAVLKCTGGCMRSA